MYVDQKETANKMFNPFHVCAKQLTSMRIPARPRLCQQQQQQQQVCSHIGPCSCLPSNRDLPYRFLYIEIFYVINFVTKCVTDIWLTDS
jgi:hypothetical protein